MPEETTISLKSRTDRHVADMLNRPHLIPRPPMQRKNCWSRQQNTDFIDSMCRGWSQSIYIITREKEGNDTDDREILEDHVFDGAHRLEAAMQFIDDKFTLGNLDDISPLKNYIGKKYSDLPSSIKQKILNYPFSINYIDPDTANNKPALILLWKRLNQAGNKLNDYELALPVIVELVEKVLKPSLPQFLVTKLFKKTESKRGEAEKLLQIIIALSESEITESYLTEASSKVGLVNLWQEKALGDKIDDINQNIQKNSEKWVEILKKARNYLNCLDQANCFVNEDGKNILKSAHRGTELVFLLGRLVYHFPKPENFKRVCSELAKAMKDKYFTTVLRDAKGRNGGFQRDTLKEIDQLVLGFCKDPPKRCFTKDQIERKLAQQNSVCAQCKEAILPNHKYHGDHILPWSMGGDSSDENCQVSHSRCNLIKGKRVDLNDLSVQ